MFPQITYGNSAALDISARIGLFQQPKAPQFYAPYQVQQGVRADNLAGTVYGDQTFDWMMYLTNNITDPYYDWTLSQEDFYNYVVTKYGSLANAQQYILYWRTAWPIDNNKYPPQWYNEQPTVVKKYFQPSFGGRNEIIYYTQTRLDWRVATNSIEQWGIEMVSGNTAYNQGDLLSIVSVGSQVGTAQVISANLTSLVVNHTFGNNAPAMAITDFSNSSIANAVILSTSVLEQDIDPAEFVYWEPVTAYMLENEKNTYKQFINLLDPSASFATYQAMIKALRGLQ
jgi:hypothetical protein